jgi:hypothetical protein
VISASALISPLPSPEVQKAYAQRWREESDRHGYAYDDVVDAFILNSAELAEEISWHELLELEDDFFEEKLQEWTDFAWERCLWLPLEQSCHDGVLLPIDQRMMRLATCPDDMLNPLKFLFKHCPVYVQSRVALNFYLLVRLDRARRTGLPEWRPQTAKPEVHEERAFFRPPVLLTRNYAR